jgi:hypothetical protein
MSTGDTITLRVPRDEGYRALLHLVLGGIASRRSMSFDAIDDVQLAVDNLLAEDAETSGELQMSVALEDDLLCITLETLRDSYLRANLTHESLPAGMAEKRIDMCVLLDSLVDGYLVHQGAMGTYAVELHKRIP